MPTFEEVKRRKIVQWALAYLAGAWLVVEVASNLAQAWDFPGVLIQGLHVVLAGGLVATLILAWYHGEQGRQRVSGPELLLLAGTERLLERERREVERVLSEEGTSD